MAFNWKAFCEKHRIEFVDRGASTARGNIYIHCPFCGSADKGHHMGLSETTTSWGCWRSTAHRGRRPHKLIMKLLNCTWQRAADLVGDSSAVFPDAFEEMILKDDLFASADDVVERPEALTLPEHTQRITPRWPTSDHFDYLLGRGFTRGEVRKLIRRFGLTGGIRGKYKYRVIAPVTLYGVPVTFTSRAVTPSAELRYLTPPDEEQVVNIKNTVYNFDRALQGGRHLVVVEGPADVWKMDILGLDHGVTAVGLFSKGLEPAQRYLMQEVIPLFEKVWVMLDAGEEMDAMRIAEELAFLQDVRPLKCRGADDPGELTPRSFSKLLTTMEES